jgi:hypothetical protein
VWERGIAALLATMNGKFRHLQSRYYPRSRRTVRHPDKFAVNREKVPSRLSRRSPLPRLMLNPHESLCILRDDFAGQRVKRFPGELGL